MGDLVRFGISIENDLLQRFDQLIGDRGYQNRSEALRDLIRDTLIQSQLKGDNEEREVLGSLTLVYDHHARELTQRLNDLQHQHHQLIISVMHAHISHDDCMEMIMLRGKSSQMHQLANKLLSLKGVKHGQLFVTLPANEIVSPNHHSIPHSHNDDHHPHK